MSPFTRQKRRVLILSRYLIETGFDNFKYHTHICRAFEYVGEKLPHLADAAKSMIDEINAAFIRDGIDRNLRDVSVSMWLNNHVGVDWCLLTPDRLKDYRIRWIDSWVHELEAGTKT